MIEGLEVGMIELDSEVGKKLGFTSDKFSKDSYLWFHGGHIWISVITSKYKRKGYLSELIGKIRDEGYSIKVPNPSIDLEAILVHCGFHMTIEEYDDILFRNGKVWVKEIHEWGKDLL